MSVRCPNLPVEVSEFKVTSSSKISSIIMREIVTIQLGERANYLATHFWNLQVIAILALRHSSLIYE